MFNIIKDFNYEAHQKHIRKFFRNLKHVYKLLKVLY